MGKSVCLFEILNKGKIYIFKDQNDTRLFKKEKDGMKSVNKRGTEAIHT